MLIPVYFIDTFTSVAFRGNPTAVCYLQRDLADRTLQSIASEFNLPVTAFIMPSEVLPHHYSIRYFTPVTEIDACGHATLAAGEVSRIYGAGERAAFRTIDGNDVKLSLGEDSLTIIYPRYALAEMKPGENLLRTLGINQYRHSGYCTELETLFIELEDATILRSVQPDYSQMKNAEPALKEVVITSVSDDPGYDFLLRSFCPWIGIDEDPVTGSVHTVLAGYWEERLHKECMRAFQASERGGELTVCSFADRAELTGKVVVVMKGELLVG